MRRHPIPNHNQPQQEDQKDRCPGQRFPLVVVQMQAKRANLATSVGTAIHTLGKSGTLLGAFVRIVFRGYHYFRYLILGATPPNPKDFKLQYFFQEVDH